MRIKLYEYTKVFLANTSIRGFSRIIRTESIFIKWLWSVFIITNTAFLAISIHKVLLDYWQYSVNIQTYTRFDNATPFPAVTFCNHQPFSLTAYNLWSSGHVMSPTNFNKRLRNLALKYLDKLEQNPNFYDMDQTMLWSTAMDRVSIYYQSLAPDISAKLGHNQSMFHHCMWWYGKNMAFGDNCNDTMLIVKKFSHPSYFNCYTVEPIKNVSMEVSRIGAIVWLGPNEENDIHHKQGFLFDIFEQAYGLRVAVHEAGTYPNIDQIGRQIEPGRLNELNFQPVMNIRVNSPTKKCINDPQTTYQDLDRQFKYDKELCLNYEMQKVVVEKCRCVYGYYPRYFTPNKTLNYCGYLNFTNDQDVMERMRCLKEQMDPSSGLKNSLEEKVCLLRCRNFDYDLAVSVTKWRPTEWQLYWLKQVTQQFQNAESTMDKLFKNNINEWEITKSKRQLKTYFQYIRNFMKLSNLTLNVHTNTSNAIFGDRYSFVVIKRRDNNTFVKEERFVLTISALISRIGGLSSLYIGLTFAFFAEVIEYVYVCLFSKREDEKPKDNVNVISIDSSPPKADETQTIPLNNNEHNQDTKRFQMFPVSTLIVMSLKYL